MTSQDTPARPLTLRQMAGAPSAAPSLSEGALLIIDAQREYLDGLVPLPDIGPALNNIERLLSAARTANLPVIHVAHHGAPGGAFDPAVGGKIIDQVAPLDTETIVTKALPNSFANTNLREVLTELGDPHLVICGFMTHMCVSATARAALDLELTTTVVSDATGTRALPGPDATSIISHTDLHVAELAALGDRFSFITSTSELL